MDFSNLESFAIFKYFFKNVLKFINYQVSETEEIDEKIKIHKSKFEKLKMAKSF